MVRGEVEGLISKGWGQGERGGGEGKKLVLETVDFELFLFGQFNL